MAIYHYSESSVSRSSGRSATAAAAYITASRIADNRTGLVFDYGNKGCVVLSFEYVPDNAPEWTKSAQERWNNSAAFEDTLADDRFRGHAFDEEKNERSLRARFDAKASAVEAHSVIIALPKEFTLPQSKEVVCDFLDRYLKPRRLCATVAFHEEEGNPHCHLLINPRSLEEGQWNRVKCRDFNSREELTHRRALWAQVVNEKAQEWSIDARIDHRSFKDQGISITPTRHEGWYGRDVLKNASRIVQENEEIRRDNVQILFENPADILRLVSSRKPVLTHQEISIEIFKRVGGDDHLWHLLSQKVNAIDATREGDWHTRADLKVANNFTKDDLDVSAKQDITDRYLTRLLEDSVFVNVGQNVKGERVYTTYDMLEREENFDLQIDALACLSHFEVSLESAHKTLEARTRVTQKTLDIEQRLALEGLICSSGLAVMEGRAGTGKTFVLESLKHVYEAQGFRLLGGAFQGRTAEHLEADTAISSRTLDAYKKRWDKIDAFKASLSQDDLSPRDRSYLEDRLKALEPFDLDSKTVFVVDEAFTAPTRLLEALFERARSCQAKVVLAGDSRQTLSFTSSDAGRAVVNRVGSISLENIRRQHQDWQKKASLELSRHEIWEGYHPYDERGFIHPFEEATSAKNALVSDYITHIYAQPDPHDAFRATAILAPRNESVEDLNKAIVASLCAQKRLGKGNIISSEREALMKEHADLLAHKTSSDFKDGTRGARALEKTLGEIADKISHLEKTRVFYEGQRVVFTSNDYGGFYVSNVEADQKHLGVQNGTHGTFLKCDKGRVYVRLDDNREVFFDSGAAPSSSKEFIQTGYAMTVHKAQGLTRDHTFALFEKADANLLYVMGTRHREGFQGYFDQTQASSFKDFAISCERSEYRPLVSDYTIDAANEAFFGRVSSYVELTCDISSVLTSLGEMNDTQVTDPLSRETLKTLDGAQSSLFVAWEESGAQKRAKMKEVGWQNYHQLKERRSLIAREMVEEGLDQHHPFLAQAGIRASVIQVEAGVRTRSLTKLERSARQQTHLYANACDNARTLWQEMVHANSTYPSAHPSFAAFQAVKGLRDRLAFDITQVGSLALYKPFLKEQGLFFKTLESHSASHVHTLKQEALCALSPQLGAALRDYLQKRGLVSRQSQDSPQNRLAGLHRDKAAFEVMGALTSMHVQLIDAFLDSGQERALLHHAARHEARPHILAYRQATNLGERGAAALHLLSYARLTDLFKEHGLHRDHLTFEAALGRTSPLSKTLPSLEDWKAADLERRSMFKAAFKHQKSSTGAHIKPKLVIDTNIMHVFEKACAQLYREVGHMPLFNAEKTPVFGLLENTSRDGFKGRKARLEKHDQHTKTRLSARDFDALMMSVTRDVDMASLSTRVLENHGIAFNSRLSNENILRFGQKGSIAVHVKGQKAGSWYSFEEAVGGNVISLVKHYEGGSFMGALETIKPFVSGRGAHDLEAFLGNTPERQYANEHVRDVLVKIHTNNDAEKTELKVAHVRRLAGLAKPLEGTQAATYLASRGLHNIQSRDLMYIEPDTHFEYDGKERVVRRGALLTLARDGDGHIRAGQMTYLDGLGKRATYHDGTKIPKLTYGSSKGALVTLQESGAGPLFVSEGVETCLSLVQTGIKGTFKASLGLGNMRLLNPPLNQDLILVADWDGEGAKTHDIIKKTAHDMAHARGKEPTILWPETRGDQKIDFNDLLSKEGVTTLKKVVLSQVGDILNPEIARLNAPENDKIKALHGVYLRAESDKELFKDHHFLIEQKCHDLLKDKHTIAVLDTHTDTAFKQFVDQHIDAHEQRHGLSCQRTLERYIAMDRQNRQAPTRDSEHWLATQVRLHEMAHRISKNPDLMACVHAANDPHMTQALQERAQTQEAHLAEHHTRAHTQEFSL